MARAKPAVTHADLVSAAAKWLANTKRCPVVITDMASAASETPDAIGWLNGQSHLVECKASRADYAVDHEKRCRRHAEQAMGVYRYYLTPFEMVKPDELPPKWGLLWLKGRSITVQREPYWHTTGRRDEVHLLVSAVRRLATTQGVRGMSVRLYQHENPGARATLSAERMPWIAVADKLPECGQLVLAGSPPQVYTAHDEPWYTQPAVYDSAKSQWLAADDTVLPDIVVWRPLAVEPNPDVAEFYT